LPEGIKTGKSPLQIITSLHAHRPSAKKGTRGSDKNRPFIKQKPSEKRGRIQGRGCGRWQRGLSEIGKVGLGKTAHQRKKEGNPRRMQGEGMGVGEGDSETERLLLVGWGVAERKKQQNHPIRGLYTGSREGIIRNEGTCAMAEVVRKETKKNKKAFGTRAFEGGKGPARVL